MKAKFLWAGLFAFAVTTGQAQTSYVQVEVMNVTPKADKLDLFKKGIAAHNKKYHASDPYKVSVSYVLTGPGAGSYVWIMGPTTWTQMDARPGKGEHDLDWDKNVTPYTESTGAVTYWRLNQDVSYQPQGGASLPKARVRNHFVRPGQGDRFIEQMKKVSAVYKKKQYKSAFDLWEHQDATQGPNFVSITSWANWAARDSGTNFIKDFEEVNGAGSYARFIDELELCIDRSKTYDELIESVAELGG
jgi:hypothetical protein